MGERILIIEDDAALSRMMRLQLEQAGYRVTVCGDGLSGIQSVRDSDPDLILLDILLPDIDGWVVCERLQEITATPIIFATALGSERDVIRGLELGAFGTRQVGIAPGAARSRPPGSRRNRRLFVAGRSRSADPRN